jgi:hypothetical protein
MNKKILAIPVVGAVVAVVAKKMGRSGTGQEQQAATEAPAPPDAPEGGPDAGTDGQSVIR